MSKGKRVTSSLLNHFVTKQVFYCFFGVDNGEREVYRRSMLTVSTKPIRSYSNLKETLKSGERSNMEDHVGERTWL
jgi:hypothetical protein